MHLILLSIVVPSMFIIVWAVPTARQPKIWTLCLGIVVSVLIAVVGVDVAQFIATSENSAANVGGVFSRGAMRALFAVIMMTNIPLLACVAGSCLNWFYSRRWQAQKKPKAESASG